MQWNVSLPSTPTVADGPARLGKKIMYLRMYCATLQPWTFFSTVLIALRAQLLEGKANLLRLRQDIPLVDAELAAVEDGLTAYEQLLAKLVDVPTPAGPHDFLSH
jgi:hypothetical protein